MNANTTTIEEQQKDPTDPKPNALNHNNKLTIAVEQKIIVLANVINLTKRANCF